MYKKQWLLTDQQLSDVNPLILGEEKCDPEKSFGPHVRNYTLIHYVRSGRGILYARGGAHPVSAGQIFVILPGEVTTYTADAAQPWHYCWVGFNGRLAQGFRQLPPVLDVPQSLFLALFPEPGRKNPELFVAGGLLRLCAQLLSEAQHSGSHVQKVENLISQTYMQPLRVADIAEALHLDRRYLTRIFREQTGLSIQQHLIRVRLEAADRYLTLGYTVQEAAALCGYEDSGNFSRLYKKYRGCSPKAKRPKP